MAVSSVPEHPEPVVVCRMDIYGRDPAIPVTVHRGAFPSVSYGIPYWEKIDNFFIFFISNNFQQVHI